MAQEIQYIKMIESLVLKTKIFTFVWEELTSKQLYIEKQNDFKILPLIMYIWKNSPSPRSALSLVNTFHPHEKALP
jgi:hypothetical protein